MTAKPISKKIFSGAIALTISAVATQPILINVLPNLGAYRAHPYLLPEFQKIQGPIDQVLFNAVVTQKRAIGAHE